MVTCSATLSALEKAPYGVQWPSALQLLHWMHVRHLEPQVISYNACISACEKAERWQQALQLMKEAEEQGIEVNVITYNAAISACHWDWEIWAVYLEANI